MQFDIHNSHRRTYIKKYIVKNVIKNFLISEVVFIVDIIFMFEEVSLFEVILIFEVVFIFAVKNLLQVFKCWFDNKHECGQKDVKQNVELPWLELQKKVNWMFSYHTLQNLKEICTVKS